MDKKLLGLVGIMSVAIPAGAMAAPAPQELPAAASFNDLLQPIPNAGERLKAIDAVATDDGTARLERVQFHHHHHHHNIVRRLLGGGGRYHHHHHHHHYRRDY